MGQTGAGKSFFFKFALKGRMENQDDFRQPTIMIPAQKKLKLKIQNYLEMEWIQRWLTHQDFMILQKKERKNKKEKPETFKMIENLSKEINDKLNNKINRIFLFIGAQYKIDQQKQNIIKIFKMFVAASIRITVIITKFNTVLI